ncbi:hypothetical protein T310_9086, partial [Rasamsonia emersonii CBS 393.64]
VALLINIHCTLILWLFSSFFSFLLLLLADLLLLLLLLSLLCSSLPLHLPFGLWFLCLRTITGLTSGWPRLATSLFIFFRPGTRQNRKHEIRCMCFDLWFCAVDQAALLVRWDL